MSSKRFSNSFDQATPRNWQLIKSQFWVEFPSHRPFNTCRGGSPAGTGIATGEYGMARMSRIIH